MTKNSEISVCKDFHPDQDPDDNDWFYRPFKSSAFSDHTERMSSEKELEESCSSGENTSTYETELGNGNVKKIVVLSVPAGHKTKP